VTAQAVGKGAQEGGSTPLVRQVSKETTNNSPPQRANYAAMASRSLSKTESRNQWNGIRSEIDTTSVSEEMLKSPPVMFTREQNGHAVTIPYPPGVRADALLKVVRDNFKRINQIDILVPGRISFMYLKEEDLNADFQETVKVGNTVLHTVRACYSGGIRLKIKVDYLRFGTQEQRQQALREVFKKYGEIIHFQFHYLKGTEGTKISMGSLEFTLDMPATTSRNIKLPRVAVVMDSNTLFSWGNGSFCYRCGKGDHVKASCPKPFDYILKEDLPIAEP
ncbi:hypothetical protein BGX26_008135, partial [Mortierella sp. AD094]